MVCPNVSDRLTVPAATGAVQIPREQVGRSEQVKAPANQPARQVLHESVRLGIVSHTGKIDHDAWLVADSPSIVSGGNGHNIAGADLKLSTVVHQDYLAARQHISNVRCLATVRSGYGLHVVRPLPSWLERREAYDAVSDVDNVNVTLVLKLTRLI